MQVDFSDCGSAFAYALDWKLVNEQSGATVYSLRPCDSRLVSSVPAGDYRLEVTRNGYTGTYRLGLSGP